MANNETLLTLKGIPMKKETVVFALYVVTAVATATHAAVEVHKTFAQSRRDKKLMLRKENLKTNES